MRIRARTICVILVQIDQLNSNFGAICMSNSRDGALAFSIDAKGLTIADAKTISTPAENGY
jgi:hypothetical protein